MKFTNWQITFIKRFLFVLVRQLLADIRWMFTPESEVQIVEAIESTIVSRSKDARTLGAFRTAR